MNQRQAKKLRKLTKATAVERELSLDNRYVINERGTIMLQECARGLYQYAKRKIKNAK